MRDLIEREDAIRAVGEAWGKAYRVIDALKSIPSAEHKGEWIWSDTDGFICSAGGNGYKSQPTCMGKPMFEYCPFCGAKMKGTGDGR